jgi:hypothetical protein
MPMGGLGQMGLAPGGLQLGAAAAAQAQPCASGSGGGGASMGAFAQQPHMKMELLSAGVMPGWQ